MVKIAFNSSLAQKSLVKEVPVSEKDPETGSVYSTESSTGRCLLTLLGLAFIISGLIVGGACVYRYFTPKKLYHGSMQFTDMPMDMEAHAPYYLPRVDEDIEIRDNVAIINIPAPRFGAGDPAYILHDFKKKLTAYLDLSLRTCFVIPLNTSVVMLPQDLLDLFLQLMSGSYKTHLVREDLVVTERIDDLTPLGYYIYSLCEDKPTYRMQRRSEIMGLQKRSVEDCSIIRHFENKFVTETKLCRA